jgi:hypothetical protein
LLVWVALIENIGNNSTQHGIAQVFQTLVVDVLLALFTESKRLVHQSSLIEPDVARQKTQNVSELQKRLLFLLEEEPK